ncbi:DUF3846 domain-containing protein [Streptomyces sp. NPDC053720]|uniref:DUF3846 domain-containing protein n=1 Tax=Streptomyces sp. NPDC053720 TaxID=3154855 RepID=UPI0034120D53
MSATATAIGTFALWVPPTGTFRLLHWNITLAPQHALCCDKTQSIELTAELTMWSDQQAIPLGHPRNARASELLLTYQPHPGLHFGDVVFTGAPHPDGAAAHGLTENQALDLVGRYLARSAAHVPAPQNR